MEDHGLRQSWTNVSDGFFETGSIGAIAVAESNPNVIYVGTGSAGDPQQRDPGPRRLQVDRRGQDLEHIGLRDVGADRRRARAPEQRRIVAYVAALGQPFGDEPERGVFSIA